MFRLPHLLYHLNTNLNLTFLQVLQHGNLNTGGFAEILQEVIEEVEDVRFSVVTDDDYNAYLIYRPEYPWINLTEAETQLTEDKIAFSRQFYNDTVTNYNDQIQVFPSNIVASMFNFTEEQTFLVDDAEAKKAPKVQF